MLLLEHHTAAEQGLDHADTITALDDLLDAPLAGELTDEQAALAERQRVARDNQAAHERLVGLMSMERKRR